MDRLSYSVRCAIVVELATRLRARGSWCGETHLQKATFIIQDLIRLNLGYKFVLYKHGPYSFEFNSEMNSMRAANVFEFQFPREGYGPGIAPTTFGMRVREANEENIREYIPVIKFIADWFAANDVRHLEKIATAYYVTKRNPRDPAFERAKRLSSLKPHVDIDSAEEAVRVVDEKRQQAKAQWAQIAA
jgi:hypothetical protein